MAAIELKIKQIFCSEDEFRRTEKTATQTFKRRVYLQISRELGK